MSGKVLNAVCNLITFAIVTIVVDLAELGQYVYLVAITAVSSVLASFGGSELVFHKGAGDRAKIPALLKLAIKSRAMIGTLIGLVATLLGYFVSGNKGLALAFFMAYAAMIFDAKMMANVAAFRALGCSTSEWKAFVLRGAVKCMAVMLLLPFDVALWQVFSLLTLVNVMGAKYSSFLYKQTSLELRIIHERWGVAQFLKESRAYFAMAFMLVFTNQFGTLFLGTFGPESEVGLYGASVRIFMALCMVIQSVAIPVQRSLSMLFEGDKAEWAKRCRYLAGVALLLAVGVAAASQFTASVATQAVFGEKFVAAEPAMSILLLAYAFKSVSITVLMPAFISSNSLKTCNLLFALCLFAQLCVCLALIETIDAVAVAKGVLASEVLFFALALMWLARAVQHPCKVDHVKARALTHTTEPDE